MSQAQDQVAGLCSAAFAWPFRLADDEAFEVDVRLPVDLYSGPADLAEIRATPATDRASRACTRRRASPNASAPPRRKNCGGSTTT
ncbi:hypothetical protein [Streptomyces sp. NPDC017941]|uniref:hypothetical protein n=1 Tax=Streptomyces sp. NPDC017941 TaxID=3365018 RepID=UPI0037AED370